MPGYFREQSQMNRQIIVGVCACLFLTYAACTKAEIRYRVTDLGTLGGTTSYGGAINSSGNVVGTSYLAGDNLHVHNFLYDGTMHDISDIGWVTDINDTGQLSGNLPVGTIIHGFYYDGTRHDLGTLGGNFTYAYGINERGQITGNSQTSEFNDHVFLYDGSMHDLGVGWGLGINDSGWITGRTGFAPDFEPHAFLFDGVMHDLGTLGGISSQGAAINDKGQVTGNTGLSNGFSHAFLYDGMMHDLGALEGGTSDGFAINNNGQVVGNSYTTTQGLIHAFVYDSDHGMLDLNDLVDPQLGWVFWTATGINDSGQISGTGTIDGNNHAFLLTPIPEPSGLAVAGVGILCAAAWWRRRSV
jgi:probable HAF family extracellular repeat protein